MGLFSWLDRKLFNGEPKNNYGIRPSYRTYSWRSILDLECRDATRYPSMLRAHVTAILDQLEVQLPLEKISESVKPSLDAWIATGVARHIISESDAIIARTIWADEVEHSQTPLTDALEALG